MHSLLPPGNKIIPLLLTPLNVLIMIVTIILGAYGKPGNPDPEAEPDPEPEPEPEK